MDDRASASATSFRDELGGLQAGGSGRNQTQPIQPMISQKYRINHYLTNLLSTGLVVAVAAGQNVIQQTGTEDVKFQAGAYHSLTEAIVLDNGDGTLRTLDSSGDGLVTYRIEFTTPGFYYLYFDKEVGGNFTDDSVYINHNALAGGGFGATPGESAAERWNSLDLGWNGLSGIGGDGVGTDREYEIDPGTPAYGWEVTAADIGSFVEFTVRSRESNLVWRNFVFSSRDDLSAAELDALALSPGGGAPDPDRFLLRDFRYDSATGEAEVSLLGQPSTTYVLVGAADLDFGNAAPIPLTGATVGVAEADRITTTATGEATVQFNLGTGQPAFFVRGEPAPPLLSADFEGVVLPAGWVVTDNGNGTAWELGVPNGSSFEPSGPLGGALSIGTNMNASYTNDAGCSLVSPSFVVPPGGGTLRLSYYIDTQELTGGPDFGTIRLLNAADDTPLTGGELAPQLQGVEALVNDAAFPLPAAAAGQEVKVEFAFQSDDQGSNFSGFYIDDVVVAVD